MDTSVGRADDVFTVLICAVMLTSPTQCVEGVMQTSPPLCVCGGVILTYMFCLVLLLEMS